MYTHLANEIFVLLSRAFGGSSQVNLFTYADACVGQVNNSTVYYTVDDLCKLLHAMHEVLLEDAHRFDCELNIDREEFISYGISKFNQMNGGIE